MPLISMMLAKRLAYGLPVRSLHATVQAFGEVVSCRVLRFRDGTSKQVGFVCMSSHEEAALCVEHLHGAQVVLYPR